MAGNWQVGLEQAPMKKKEYLIILIMSKIYGGSTNLAGARGKRQKEKENLGCGVFNSWYLQYSYKAMK
jgi:hypothetical protein